jgi:hypothetical protein
VDIATGTWSVLSPIAVPMKPTYVDVMAFRRLSWAR